MKYLIMECHMAYAVVLDEDGRFLKAANMDYEVGQTVDTIMAVSYTHLTLPTKRIV